MEEKIKATDYIYNLARRTERLATIAQHSSALGALARVLREEGRKSFNLRLNIVSIFFMMSFFPKFHQRLLEQKIGKTTLNILVLEVQCMETMMQEFLCKILVRKSIALLIITVTFLKKLSIFKQNMDVMKENGIIYRLSVLIRCQHESLLLAVLRLLWNLSFDPGLRMDMIKCKVIQALEMLLKDKKFEHLVFGLLYNLSTDAEGRKAFLETDIGPMILEAMTVESRQNITGELVALAVNLTTLPHTSEIICRSQGLERFIQRAIQFRNPLLFKVIKNISQSETAKPQLIRFLPALIDVIKRPDSCTFLQVEVMKIFNQMTTSGDVFYRLVEDTDLLQFFAALMKSSLMEEEEIFLEIVVFVGAVRSDRIAAKIADSGLVRRMCTYFLQKKKDSEIVLQLLWTLGQLLLHATTSKEVVTCDKVRHMIASSIQIVKKFVPSWLISWKRYICNTRPSSRDSKEIPLVCYGL
ncbi:hypothetical protein Mapa_006250 [Marchantia paleacea]|nr:hypothetical protein Mapa_006250 [Marchantia paleacea]